MDAESPPRAGNQPTACGLSSTNGRESGSKLPDSKYRVTGFRSIGTAAIDAPRFACWERVHACADRLELLDRGAK